MKNVDTEWVIGNKTVKPGEKVTLDVSVKGNTAGFNSYIAKVKSDVAADSAANGGFSDLNFNYNADSLTFAGTDFSKGNETITGDGAVFTISFTAPATPGIYPVDFDTLQVYGIGLDSQIVKTTNGWIEVVEDAPQEKEVDTEWVIGNATVKPGEEVVLNVSVNGNTAGFNSYLTTLKTEGGIPAKSAGGRMDGFSFVTNPGEFKFGGTSTAQSDIAKDGNVFAVRFVAPTEPGKSDSQNC